jgi:hypothetical protein
MVGQGQRLDRRKTLHGCFLPQILGPSHDRILPPHPLYRGHSNHQLIRKYLAVIRETAVKQRCASRRREYRFHLPLQVQLAQFQSNPSW